jgi:hypothetical protein
LPSGVTFRESERNSKVWTRWYRYLVVDQWVVFFVGAIIGMFLPSMLCVSLTQRPVPGVVSIANVPVYLATELGRVSSALLPFILLLGTLILFKTQTILLEMLVRNTVDAANSVSPRLRSWIKGDARKAYYVIAILYIIVISVIIHLALPTELLLYSANMANLSSLIFSFILIYLNTKLPRPARASWWSIAILLANVVFFGFFFFNFLSLQITGQPLVKFSTCNIQGHIANFSEGREGLKMFHEHWG